MRRDWRYSVDDLHALEGEMLRGEVGISVLDVSNAWWLAYMTPEHFKQIIEVFSRRATQDSILLTTSETYAWQYVGLNLLMLHEQPQLRHFLKLFQVNQDLRLRQGLMITDANFRPFAQYLMTDIRRNIWKDAQDLL